MQAGAARKQLDKLQKEAVKGEAERQKLAEQQQAAMQVRLVGRGLRPLATGHRPGPTGGQSEVSP